MPTKLVNLTPHPVVLALEGEERVIPPSGGVARVSTTTEVIGTLDGVPVVRTRIGQVIGLPEPEVGTVYIVSSLVAQAAAAMGRDDVLAPDTGPDSAVRDADGRIVAVRRLQAFR